MANKTPLERPDAPLSTEASSPGVAKAGRTWPAKLAALGVVMVVVMVECLSAYLFLPSAAQTAEMAAATPSAPKEAASEEHGEKTEGKAEKNGKHGKTEKAGPDHIEVDLGEYSVTAAHPTANTTLQITFHLYGTIAALDEEEFNELRKECEHRFREQVLVSIRSAKISDLTDAGLGLLKRTILEKTNRVLGKPILQAVIFSDFVFIEQ